MAESPACFDGQQFLQTVPQHPGVYRMLGDTQTILYVGKARNLKNRLSSYFRKELDSPKTRALMASVVSVEFTVTRTEKEALILEHNLIKKHRPRFNIIFRDDKSYPYIHVTTDHIYPRFSFYRGSKRQKGRFFGPYPSAGSIRQVLNLLQKTFLVRPCEDSYFNHRSRPCLQYQIKRCSAPCVKAIEPQAYQDDVRHALLFLAGKNQSLLDELVKKMETCSTSLDFESAAQYRDQIKLINKACEGQYVESQAGEVDVIYCDSFQGVWAVQLMFIRSGKVLGDRTFFPKNFKMAEGKEVLQAFIQQYYLKKDWPQEIVLNTKVDPQSLQWFDSDSDERHKKWPKTSCPSKGIRQQWLQLAERNLKQALQINIANKTAIDQRWQALASLVGMEDTLQRVECFDISHISGTETVASCVVFGSEGAINSQYRRFKIDNIKAGDDYAAMEQVLRRRYARVKKEEGVLPSLVLIDGGKGQLSRAEKVFEELALEVMLMGVAKGPERIAGQETLFLVGEKEALPCDEFSPALQQIQQIRDEAHRFAITGHRQRRAKSRKRSLLEDIPGIGAKRRRELINYFGGAREVMAAAEEDLMRVPGISRAMAQRVFRYLNTE